MLSPHTIEFYAVQQKLLWYALKLNLNMSEEVAYFIIKSFYL